ncbi:MAG: esterase [Actinobacteria bacterium]|nr:esterase [Actinomycetota bacterium]
MDPARLSGERAPEISDTHVQFELADPERAFEQVSLCQELMRPRCGIPFERVPGEDAWQLRFPRLEVDRMEYRFQVARRGRDQEQILDPGNPDRAPGPFGEKSVVEFPEYSAPSWLSDEPAPDGAVTELEIPSRTLRATVAGVLWAAPGVGERDAVPLLVAHDGLDYRDYSALLMFLERMVAAGRLPKMRAALLRPVHRHQNYSTSAAYARAVAHEILPALEGLAPTPPGRAARVGIGASLGALAMLHVHRTNAASFGALFLQSGSFFRQRFDKIESGFVRFARIARFMGTVLGPADWPHPIPITMTCGRVEENLANNRATHAALNVQGYDVDLIENPDAHNWVAWRDTFEPHLVDLLARVWA